MVTLPLDLGVRTPTAKVIQLLSMEEEFDEGWNPRPKGRSSSSGKSGGKLERWRKVEGLRLDLYGLGSFSHPTGCELWLEDE